MMYLGKWEGGMVVEVHIDQRGAKLPPPPKKNNMEEEKKGKENKYNLDKIAVS